MHHRVLIHVVICHIILITLKITTGSKPVSRDEMKVSKTGLCLYRSLYWANQSLLQAVRALQDAERPASLPLLSADPLNDKLRRTQEMIEETRAVINRALADWIERSE